MTIALEVEFVINILFSLLIIMLSFTFFSFGYSLNGINRSVINIPNEYFNVSIPLFKENEDINLYFQKEKLEGFLDKYFTVLYKYTPSYDVKYYYYNLDDQSYCFSDECQGIEIEVNCKIISLFDYHRTMFFEIGARA